MAIIKCFNCQKPVSDKQSICPYCGYELKISFESEGNILKSENAEKEAYNDVNSKVSRPFETTEDSIAVSEEFQGIFKPLRTNNLSSSEDENEALSGIFKPQNTVEEFPKEDNEIQVHTESNKENSVQYNSAMKSRRWKILAISAASLILVSVASVLIVLKFVIPQSSKRYEEKYKQAITLMDDGEYLEAVTLFEDMDGYKDSNIKISVCQTLVAYGEEKGQNDGNDVVDDHGLETKEPELTDGDVTGEETNESNADDGNSGSGIYNGEEIFTMLHDSTGADVIDVEKRKEALDDDNQIKKGFIVFANKDKVDTFFQQDKSMEENSDATVRYIYDPEIDNCNSIICYQMTDYTDEDFGKSDSETCRFYIYDDQVSAQSAYEKILKQYEDTGVDFTKANDSEYTLKDGSGYFVLNMTYKNYLEPAYKKSMGSDFYLVEYYIRPRFENFKMTFASYLVDNMIVTWISSTTDPNFVPKTYECIMDIGFEAPLKTENSQAVLDVQIQLWVDLTKQLNG